MSRYFRYLLLAIFVAAVLLIVFLQFNSNRSINNLITGNERLLNDLTTKNNLQHLQTDIIILENKISGAVIRGVSVDSTQLKAEIGNIRSTLSSLDELESDVVTDPLVKRLYGLVDEKINYTQEVLDSLKTKGKSSAEKMINSQFGKQLTDSIKSVCTRIDQLHQQTVTSLIEEADSNGKKAKTLGTIMAVIAVIASLFSFSYVAFKVRQQQQLIARLNISEKKAKVAAQAKENFLANMSHEIRTPLNAILGFTNLLQRRNFDQDSKEIILTIQRSGENLLAIINDVLDLSKIEAGMMRIESAPFSIRGLIHSIETMFLLKAAEKQLLLTTSVNSDMPDTLEGDATRLTQILVNLLGNAIKFTASGNIVVKVENNGIIDNTVNALIKVSDTGIGIEKEKLNTIFERFQQAEDTVTRRYGGTGLGLSIVQELVLLQHGTITAESRPGAGTTFTITIPYNISSENIIPIAKPSSFEGIAFEGVRVLVVEDNEINQSLIRHLFDNWNLAFEMAGNGIQALEMLKRRQYDLVLMDIQMPEMDGYSATQEIRRTLKLGIPIIAMTAHALAGEREKCLSYGMDEYISKPLREDQLRQLITRFVKIDNPKTNGLSSSTAGPYRRIKLQYLNEISMGNKEYEKTVTKQFMEIIPADLTALQKAWRDGNISLVRQTAHNMKTSISVMGLNDSLNPYLDRLEYEEMDANTFTNVFSHIAHYCEASLEEARQFYTTL